MRDMAAVEMGSLLKFDRFDVDGGVKVTVIHVHISSKK